MSVQTSDDVYLAHRDALFGLAYRMLGSVADAEDVVAEAYLRWRRDDRDDVTNARVYLFAITSRLSLDLLKSAQRTRVSYVGSWLPEPLVTSYDDSDAPAAVAERTDTISLAFLHLLERLSPQERAVFVLRSAFDFPHAQIADMLQLSPDNVRQLFAAPSSGSAPTASRATCPTRSGSASSSSGSSPLRARARSSRSPRCSPRTCSSSATVAARLPRCRVPASGRLRVARFLRGLVRKTTPTMSFEVVRANGAPALLVRDSGEPIGLYALDIDPSG